MSTFPDDQLRFDLNDPTQLGAIRHVVTAPGVFTFVPITGGGLEVIDGQPLPEGVGGAPIVTNDGIVRFALGSDQLGSPAVDIQMAPEAAEAFDTWAGTHLGERIAMVLDGIVLAAPTINASEFQGRAQVPAARSTPPPSGSWSPSCRVASCPSSPRPSPCARSVIRARSRRRPRAHQLAAPTAR